MNPNEQLRSAVKKFLKVEDDHEPGRWIRNPDDPHNDMIQICASEDCGFYWPCPVEELRRATEEESDPLDDVPMWFTYEQIAQACIVVTDAYLQGWLSNDQRSIVLLKLDGFSREEAERRNNETSGEGMKHLLAERQAHERLKEWAREAAQALEDAIVIGQRNGTPLHYGNHDRLIDELTEMDEIYRQSRGTT